MQINSVSRMAVLLLILLVSADMLLGDQYKASSVVLMMTLYCFYLFLFFICNFRLAAVSAYVLYAYFGVALGLVFAETGSYMIEVKEEGYPNGALMVLVLYSVVFLEIMNASYSFFERFFTGINIPSVNKKLEVALSALSVSVVLVLSFVFVLIYSSPVFMGVERSTFFSIYAPSWSKVLYSAFLQFFFFVAFFFFSASKRAHIRLSKFVVLVYFAFIFIVFGEKFSGVVALFLVLVAMYGAHRARPSQKLFIYSAVLLVFSFVLVFYSYYLIGRDPVEFIGLRIALQGQLMWSVMSDSTLSLFGSDYYRCYFLGCEGTESGVDFISKRYLPADVYSHYHEGGNTLSGFHPALALLSFGFPASLALNSLVAIVSGFLVFLFIASVASRSLFVSFLAYKVMFSLFYFHFVDPSGLVRNGVFWVSAIVLFFLLLCKDFRRTVRA